MIFRPIIYKFLIIFLQFKFKSKTNKSLIIKKKIKKINILNLNLLLNKLSLITTIS